MPIAGLSLSLKRNTSPSSQAGHLRPYDMKKQQKAQAAENAHNVGHRAELHPCTDQWMMGDRYGVITKSSCKFLTIKMDRSGRSYRVTTEYIRFI